MKRLKINLDRPQVDSKSIQARKDFDSLAKNHSLMSKPFYKSPWFFGATGLASVGVIVGSAVIFQDAPESVPDYLTEQLPAITTDAPPQENQIIALNNPNESKTKIDELVKETFSLSNQQNETYDNNFTLEQTENPEITDITEIPILDKDEVAEEVNDEVVKPVTPKIENVDLSPKIGGKVNGAISKEELFDNKGITTELDVNVIHFELHLIDGLGGKVFREESNQLNAEMKEAIQKIGTGETIYFENIKGETERGEVVRLNPLRYVLMN
ncbi:MAG: hypothetical protein ABJG68_12105 [Crocinitomicaceae bacterium]